MEIWEKMKMQYWKKTKATNTGPDICACIWDVVWDDLSIWTYEDIEDTKIVFLVRIRNADVFADY